MDLKAVRRRCSALLQTVDIPDPFDVERFAAAVAERRGRPLHLLPKDQDFGPCGLWLAFDHVDVVFYEQHTSGPHQDHIKLHELGHILWNHHGQEKVPTQLVERLFPSLDPRVVKKALGRSHYTAVEEQEAEVIATLLLSRPGWITKPSAQSPSAPEIVDRLSATLAWR